MSENGRFIGVANTKPRILRHRSYWMCIGVQRVSPRWWFRRERLVTRYGVTPQHAFNAWLMAKDGRA